MLLSLLLLRTLIRVSCDHLCRIIFSSLLQFLTVYFFASSFLVDAISSVVPVQIVSMCLTPKITFDIKCATIPLNAHTILIKTTYSHSVKSSTLYHLPLNSKLAMHDFAYTFSRFLEKLKSRVQPCSPKSHAPNLTQPLSTICVIFSAWAVRITSYYVQMIMVYCGATMREENHDASIANGDFVKTSRGKY